MTKPRKLRPNGEPEIRCAYTKLAPTASLRANPENPNQHPPEQLSLYAKILLRQGWRKAVTVSNQSGLIVTGHGAWLTAEAQGWKVVPVDYQDFKSRADELAHMLADNRLPQMSEPDPWPEPVEGADLLDSLSRSFTRYLVLPEGAADAMALWTVHCFVACQPCHGS